MRPMISLEEEKKMMEEARAIGALRPRVYAGEAYNMSKEQFDDFIKKSDSHRAAAHEFCARLLKVRLEGGDYDAVMRQTQISNTAWGQA